MCGRFYAQEDDIEDMLLAAARTTGARNVDNDAAAGIAVGEIFPGSTVLAVANSKSLSPAVFAMKWGYPKREGNGLIINARSESAADKPMFAQSAQTRRCLIPMTYYFEWEKRDSKKIKYAIMPARGGRAFLCGLYRVLKDSAVPEFVVLTRPAAENIGFIHPRMPLLMGEDNAALWLSPAHGLNELTACAMQSVDYREQGE